jgi:hypothetical protein
MDSVTERCPKCDRLLHECECYPSLAQWLGFGRERGWISPIVCETHNGIPITEAEALAIDTDDEPCIFVMRFYTDPNQHAQIHS